MKIGELASIAGCQVETVRYYEKEGLLAAPARSEGNYRCYNDQHVERLLFIRRCRTLDMSHDEIRQLLHLRDHPKESCAEINALIDAHIDHVAERIKALQALENQLHILRRHCNDDGDAGHCGILQELTLPSDVVLSPAATSGHLASTPLHAPASAKGKGHQ